MNTTQAKQEERRSTINYLGVIGVTTMLLCTAAFATPKDTKGALVDVPSVSQEIIKGDVYAQYQLGWYLYDYSDGADNQETKKWWLSAARQGYAPAQYRVSDFFEKEGNLGEAKKWLEAAVEQNERFAQDGLERLLVREARNKRFEAEKAKFLGGAKQGDVWNQNKLGLLFLKAYKHKEAQGWFEVAAKQGYMYAQYNLGVLLPNIQIKEKQAWFKKAAAQGHKGAKQSLRDLKKARKNLKQVGAKRLKEFKEAKKKAEQGEPEDQYHFALMLQDSGKTKEAKKWLEKSAKQDYGKAQNDLGVVLHNEGKTKQAKEWFKKTTTCRGLQNKEFVLSQEAEYKDLKSKEQALLKSAKEGKPVPQNTLASLLEKEGKLDDAIAWYEKAGKRGSVFAQNKLGSLFEKQGKVSQSKEWYKKAAELGNIHAQEKLGFLLGKEGKLDEASKWWFYAATMRYTATQGNPQDSFRKDETKRKEAKIWLLKSANKGDAKAQFLLGEIYKEQGDFKEAKIWYEKAAKQGEVFAQYDMGVLLHQPQRAKMGIMFPEESLSHPRYLRGDALGSLFSHAWGNSGRTDPPKLEETRKEFLKKSKINKR